MIKDMQPDYAGTLFSRFFYDYKTQKLKEIQYEIEHADKTYILNVDEQVYITQLVEKYQLEHVSIDLDSMGVYEEHEEEISITDMFGDEVTTKQVEYEIEFSFKGDPTLLTLQPQSSRVMRQEFKIYPGNKARFMLKNWNPSNPNQVKVDLDQIKNNLDLNVKDLNSDITTFFNAALENHIKSIFERRKKELEQNTQNLVSLGIPIIKKDKIPETFAIPKEHIQKKIQLVITKVSSGKPTNPDPKLSDEIYKDIIQTIHDVGKVIERLPKVYEDRDENTLRDLLLIYLEPRYTSAGGETFNSKGKTDILIRYENSNVFIAELKYWGGEKVFAETIEQLFGYLTWRDSKAAIIIFNRGKGLSNVLEKIQKVVSAHPTFVEQQETIDETWLNYTLHFPDDEAKKIKLAVQVFHLKEM